MWVTGERIAFRFPRRAIALPGVRRELTVLPQLAPALPTRIPDAAYPGRPTSEFPWPWFGSHLVAGTEIALAGLPVAGRGRLARELGELLGCLHRLTLPIAASLPIDFNERGDTVARIPRTQAALRQIDQMWEPAGREQRVFAAARDLAPDPHHVLVHGDLNQRHALVSSSGGLAGVIDWGDTCRAPRSVDLVLYWSLFDAPARAEFRAGYGKLDDASLAQARVLALFMDAILVGCYADDRGMEPLRREALAGLERTVTD